MIRHPLRPSVFLRAAEMVANHEVNSCSAWAVRAAEREVLGCRYDQGYGDILYRLFAPDTSYTDPTAWYKVRRLSHRLDSMAQRQENRDCQVLALLLCAAICETDHAFRSSGRE